MSSEEHYLRRELYELVRSDERIFEFLQSGSLDGIWFWDIENPENEWLSPRFKELFGYADDEIPHTSAWWQENIHPDDLQVVLANFEAHVKDPSHPYDQVVRYRHKDGSTIWVRCRGIAVRDENGRPVRMLGAHADVTALKESEEEPADAVSQLKQSNELLQDFVVGATHDLKQPLRNIRNLVQFLVEDHGGSLTPAVLDQLDEVQKVATGAMKQADSLLEYARSGLESFPLQDVPLDPVVRKVMEAIRKEPAHSDATLTVEGQLPEVRSNVFALEKVFQNLFGNALKYTKRTGGDRRVSVRARTDTDSPDRWVVDVEDNGIGIDPKFHESIFEVFQRLNPPGEFGGGGAGAGLSITRNILDRVHGGISVESKPGEGTTFHITLPPAPAERDSD